jgi:fatty-acyl-CoA synthase
MRGLMMDYQLLIPAVVRRAETLFGHKTVVTRRPDRTIVRHSLREVLDRTKRLGAALQQLGVRPGDRVATLAWAGHQHLEAYYAIPSIGAVLHTLNLRLHHDDVSYIVNDADDRVLIVDESMLDLWNLVRPHVKIEHVIVTGRGGSGARVSSGASAGAGATPPANLIDYEELLAATDPSRFVEWEGDEREAAAMCYTSGTTGRPKGVLYSHRALVLHSMAEGMRDSLALAEDDTVLPIVPMFHVNAWGLPFSCAMFGCNQVYAGPYMDSKSVLELLVSERVTLTGGVPTVWIGMLQDLDRNPGAYDLSHLRSIVVGGSAVPPTMIRAFEERHGLHILQLWGMTEMSPLGTMGALPLAMRDAPVEARIRYRAKQGTPLPFVEIRARSEKGLVPWDGQTMGELEVRGPWVASEYFNVPGSSDDRFTSDGWFRTGDIVTIEERGCIEIADRSKDLVKSGGEWISSVALETALMGHPAVAEAAVVAVPHPKWDERPLAVVVLKPEQTATQDELLAFLAPHFAKWWLPDVIEFASEIPRTSVGKFKKSVLREKFQDLYNGRRPQ